MRRQGSYQDLWFKIIPVLGILKMIGVDCEGLEKTKVMPQDRLIDG
jgi:hypothetical protein